MWRRNSGSGLQLQAVTVVAGQAREPVRIGRGLQTKIRLVLLVCDPRRGYTPDVCCRSPKTRVPLQICALRALEIR